MKTKQYLIVAAVALVSVYSFSSCQSREERIISRYESLCDDLENEDDLDEDDFVKYTEEYEDIIRDSEGCAFTHEQQKIVVKMNGRYLGVMTRKMPKTLLKKSGNLLRDGMDLVRGFVDGFTESDDINDDLNDAMDDAMDEMDNAMDELDEAMNDLDEELDDIDD